MLSQTVAGQDSLDEWICIQGLRKAVKAADSRNRCNTAREMILPQHGLRRQ